MNLASHYCKYIQRALNCTVVFRDEASGEGMGEVTPAPPPATLPNVVKIYSHSVKITWSFGITGWSFGEFEAMCGHGFTHSLGSMCHGDK